VTHRRAGAVGEEENMKLEHRLSYVALIGTIAPMVGLLGTVDGMIISFSVIANSATQPKPSELAQGIATALVSIPNRYMHSPNELVSLDDLDRAAELIAETCRAVDDSTDFTAR
jgi:hypothetical protein